MDPTDDPRVGTWSEGRGEYVPATSEGRELLQAVLTPRLLLNG
jgi:hypothetical protein